VKISALTPGSNKMTVLGQIRAILLTIMLAAIALPGAAAAQGYMKLAQADMLDGHKINLGVNKSVVVDLPQPVGDVLVSNPQIADAVLRTSTRLYLIGVDFGQASVFLFDSAGQQIGNFDIYVAADVSGLNQLLAEAIPNGYVRADSINKSIVLRGQVQTASDASRAVEIATKMLPEIITSTTSGSAAGAQTNFTQQTVSDASQPGIVNLISIAGEEQVALKVTISEVQREVVKQLGLNDVTGILTKPLDTFGVSLANPALPSTAGAAFAWQNLTGDSVDAFVQALDQTNMSRTLAEPTLTTVSGETADFLAGGEFPFVVDIEDQNGRTRTTVEFKRFGVQLAFTPVVLSQGRISLKVRTEVSEISSLSEGGVPVLNSRRAETTVELPSGGAFVIAGLVQENTRRAASGIPALKKIPILGSLFSSKDFSNRETELVMIVTAYLVKPTSPQALARPDDNMFMASDAETYFLNRLTKVYGTDGQVPGGAAAVGFTFD
jgi:pilus assembly protein CpaC